VDLAGRQIKAFGDLDAMQIHGGFGYAEEYSVSRYFVDARVLSIFEGADETLCLKVIARRMLDAVK
jgi:(2S)-methylsuccinyl-CoA dehydrogenase